MTAGLPKSQLPHRMPSPPAGRTVPHPHPDHSLTGTAGTRVAGAPGDRIARKETAVPHSYPVVPRRAFRPERLPTPGDLEGYRYPSIIRPYGTQAARGVPRPAKSRATIS